MAIPWAFRGYTSKEGCVTGDEENQCNDIVTAWSKKKLSTKGKAKLDAKINQLKDKPKDMWLRPDASSIGDGVYVIHFSDENRTQHRPVGSFLDSYNSFVITIIAIEKDDKYKPKTYFATAKERFEHVLGDPESRSRPIFTDVVLASIPASDSKKLGK